MTSEFKENAEDLNTGDSIQVDVNPLDVEAIRARLDAATPGPWFAGGPGPYGDDCTVTMGDDFDELALCPDCGTRGGMTAANALLVSHAPTDLHRLLDENARLAAEVDRRERQIGLHLKLAHEESTKAERMRVERDRAINECDDWETKYAELSVERDALRRALSAAPEMPRPPAEVDRLRSECAALAAKVDAVRALELPAGDWSHRYALGYEAALHAVRAALDASGMPHAPAEEAQERPETPGTGSGRGTGVAETQISRQASEVDQCPRP